MYKHYILVYVFRMLCRKWILLSLHSCSAYTPACKQVWRLQWLLGDVIGGNAKL